jgi:hypothetical protein
MADNASDKQEATVNPLASPAQEQTVCLRCKSPGPVSSDGFCDKCEQLMEQACL